jgi:hypothetical protein
MAAANRALKGALERLVFNPETGKAELHWRDSDVISEVPVSSRRLLAFAGP